VWTQTFLGGHFLTLCAGLSEAPTKKRDMVLELMLTSEAMIYL